MGGLRMSDLSVSQSCEPDISEKDILNSLPLAALVIRPDNRIALANAAAESLLGLAEAALRKAALDALFGIDNQISPLVERIRAGSGVVVARDLPLSGILKHMMADVQAAQIADHPGFVLLVLEERRLPGVMRRQSTVEGAARSVFGLAGMLAHEIKNPLSGIRGAAQLLEKQSAGRGRAMAILIRDEVDRIKRLVDQLESFTDVRPFTRQALNIHTVLNHVRAVAKSGFASHVQIVESYDPSLPPVLGDRDRLVQLFLNLVKNAAEAVPASGGVIRIGTAFRHGLRMAAPDGAPVDLPVEITISDNGPGIRADLADHIFEPFVTGREGGSGLGLAMVAKLVAELGGLVEVECPDQGGTHFILLFRAANDAGGEG